MQKILLVDDDPDDQFFFRDALSEISDNVTCDMVNNGFQAIQSLTSVPLPDMIFLDLNMPVMNGFDCLAELRKKENLNEIPIVIYTTSSDMATIKQLHDMGADAFFKKPVDFPTMIDKLKQAIFRDFRAKNSNRDFSIAEFTL